MTQQELIQKLADRILAIQKDSPVLVGVDGIDASGKTTLADSLVKELEKSGRSVIRASIDGFHNPKSVRYAKGKESTEGYYEDSFNYQALVDSLLKPLSSGKEYKTAVFDFLTDSAVEATNQTPVSNSILVMEGVFMFRPQLVHYWDLKIFLDVDFEVSLKRASGREMEQQYIGEAQEIRDKYNKRYIPGQKLYFEKVNPKELADIVIDNNDFENPKIVKE